MTSQEFRTAQAALRLKNHDIQRMFDVSDQTVVNWRHGYTRIPGAVAWSIRQMLESARAQN
jgi:hypothetical protein